MPRVRNPSKSGIEKSVLHLLKADQSVQDIHLHDQAALICADSRRALRLLSDNSVDCIITSPPYGPLKDYETNLQIGYGQHVTSEYFRDLALILKQLLRIAREGSALWVVLDTWKSNGSTVPLPLEVARIAQRHGWTLHDIVIWDKGRSLPWSHNGRFRTVVEHILLLGKGRLKTFDLRAVRDAEHLSSYWMKYPERYHPWGKAPSDLWHFPIPVQGSWSRTGIRHYCPFPIGLVARMLALTSRPGDLVLDPFAGTGSVLVTSSVMGRRSIGIEANSEMCSSFIRSGFDALQMTARRELSLNGASKRGLRRLIPRLRALKYPKALYSQLQRADRLGLKASNSIICFIVTDFTTAPENANGRSTGLLASITVKLLLRQDASMKRILTMAKQCAAVPPLSKYGLSVTLKAESIQRLRGSSRRQALDYSYYVYRNGRFYATSGRLNPLELCEATSKVSNTTRRQSIPLIVSDIRMNLASNPSD